jgi:hypothetical protein
VRIIFQRLDLDAEHLSRNYDFFSTLASSSLASEWIKGKNIDEAGKIKNSDIAKVSWIY